jgi:hypothetical protein
MSARLAGCEFQGAHDEICLSDPGRVKSERRRTILEIAVRRA